MPLRSVFLFTNIFVALTKCSLHCKWSNADALHRLTRSIRFTRQHCCLLRKEHKHTLTQIFIHVYSELALALDLIISRTRTHTHTLRKFIKPFVLVCTRCSSLAMINRHNEKRIASPSVNVARLALMRSVWSKFNHFLLFPTSSSAHKMRTKVVVSFISSLTHALVSPQTSFSAQSAWLLTLGQTQDATN